MTRTLSSRMDPERSAQVRALLADTVERSSTQSHQASRPVGAGASVSRQWWRNAPRPVAFGVVTLGVLGLGTGAAVSVTQFLQPDALSFVCMLGVEADSPGLERRAAVADPVAACREEWPAGAEVPELAVFMDDAGTVYVAPSAWDSGSSEATRVTQEVAFDPRPARLQAALDDQIDGLQSACFSNDEAIARVEADLQRLGLFGWSARYEDDGGREEPADGVRTCATAQVFSEGSVREVWVRGVIKGDETLQLDDVDEPELRAFFTEQYRSGVAAGQDQPLTEREQVTKDVSTVLRVRQERQALQETFPAERCLTVDRAEQEATAMAENAGTFGIETFVDDTLPCAVVEASLGGGWLVSIVGPSTLPDE